MSVQLALRNKVGYMMQRDLLLPWRTELQNFIHQAPAEK